MNYNKKYPLHDVRTITDLKDMLSQSINLYGDRTAFLYKKAVNTPYIKVTYKEFGELVNDFGSGLYAMGIKNTRVAIIGENKLQWSTAYLATVNSSNTIVPLDKELPANEINNLLLRSEATVIICSGKVLDKVKEASDGAEKLEKIICMDDASYQEILDKGREERAKGNTEYQDYVIDTERMSILLFTSGTTGTAKGVMLSQRNICSNLMAMCQMLYIDENDVFLSVLPIHHTYECTCGYLCPLYRGSSVAYCDGLKYIAKNLAEAKVTIMLCVPLIVESIYNKVWQTAKKSGADKILKVMLKVSKFLNKIGIHLEKVFFKKVHASFGGNIRMFISGASAINPDVAKGFRDMGIFTPQGYGLTECAPIIALNRGMLYKDDAAGLPLPCCEIKIANPDENGCGEFIVKGPNVMMGYYNDPEATAEVMKDGWFYTGDLGYFDEHNFAHITGRKKNVIITKNGKNVFPEEIEKYLGDSPYVSECVVYGDEREDGETYIVAQIVPNFDEIEKQFGAEFPEEELNKLMKAEVQKVNHIMVSYKRVSDFKIRKEEFEKTTTRKIKRYLVK